MRQHRLPTSDKSRYATGVCIGVGCRAATIPESSKGLEEGRLSVKDAVSYARVSSKEQEQGFSLDSQVRTLSDYAVSKAFRIVKEFRYAESAKRQGRKHFNAILDYLR